MACVLRCVATALCTGPFLHPASPVPLATPDRTECIRTHAPGRVSVWPNNKVGHKSSYEAPNFNALCMVIKFDTIASQSSSSPRFATIKFNTSCEVSSGLCHRQILSQRRHSQLKGGLNHYFVATSDETKCFSKLVTNELRLLMCFLRSIFSQKTGIFSKTRSVSLIATTDRPKTIPAASFLARMIRARTRSSAG